MSTSRDSCCLPSVKKQKHDFQVFAFVQCIIRNITPPTAQLKYNAQFVSDELDWEKIYSLPHRVAIGNKFARISGRRRGGKRSK